MDKDFLIIFLILILIIALLHKRNNYNYSQQLRTYYRDYIKSKNRDREDFINITNSCYGNICRNNGSYCPPGYPGSNTNQGRCCINYKWVDGQCSRNKKDGLPWLDDVNYKGETIKTDFVKPVNTTPYLVSILSNSGSNKLSINSVNGIKKNDVLLISPNNSNAETRTVVGIGNGDLALNSPLRYTHDPNELIFNITNKNSEYNKNLTTSGSKYSANLNSSDKLRYQDSSPWGGNQNYNFSSSSTSSNNNSSSTSSNNNSSSTSSSSSSSSSSSDCVTKNSLDNNCTPCLDSTQCKSGGFCCPYMKKCVKSSTQTCSYPIAQCRGNVCQNADYNNGKWQKKTCT